MNNEDQRVVGTIAGLVAALHYSECDRVSLSKAEELMDDRCANCPKPGIEHVEAMVARSSALSKDGALTLDFLRDYFKYITDYARSDAERSGQAFGMSGIAISVLALIGVNLLVHLNRVGSNHGLTDLGRWIIFILLTLGASLFLVAVVAMVIDYAALFHVRSAKEPKTLRIREIAVLAAEGSDENDSRAEQRIMSVAGSQDAIRKELCNQIATTAMRMVERHHRLAGVLMHLAFSFGFFIAAIIAFLEAALRPHAFPAFSIGGAVAVSATAGFVAQQVWVRVRQ